MGRKYDVCLVTTFHGPNYGSILVAYACYRLIENLGYSVLMLQKLKWMWNKTHYGDAIPQNFANRHYNVSDVYDDVTHLQILNSICDQFVTGSDQIFNPLLHFDVAFLNWVNTEKNKIAFGTSFGRDEFRASPENVVIKQHLLDRFNHIALREKSENLCNNIFKIKAEEIIDPTLILPLDEYNKLRLHVDLKMDHPFLLTYILDLTKEKAEAIKHIAGKLNLEIINISNLCPWQRKARGILTFAKDYTPEEFLFLYEHASFVVTDSYHGTCFSVKYNKPFVSFANIARGKFRYKLFDTLKVSQRVIYEIKGVYDKSELLESIDYSETNKIIHERAVFAIEWLAHALMSKKSLRNEQESEIISIRAQVIRQNTEWARLNKIGETHSQKLAQIRSMLREVVFMPLTWMNLQRCRLASHIFWGKRRRHYLTKKRLLKMRVKTVQNYLRREEENDQ